MSNLPEVTQDTFDAEVLHSSGFVMVDFGATWCGPCKMLDPIVEKLATDWAGQVKVVKVDIDHNPDLPMRYQVLGVPTLALFKDGQLVERMTGYKPKDKVIKTFLPHLS
jgi:thioredoxin 1